MSKLGRDPGHAQLEVILRYTQKGSTPSSISLPNLKRTGQFNQKYRNKGGSKISKLSHVAQATPT